jgi:alkylation response protein AidB-like acyl-CoA dehydrogenase
MEYQEMDISFDEEHDELRRTIRQFMEAESDEQAVREHMATDRGYDEKLWSRMAEELGLAGLIIPETYGGAGFGYVELLVAFEEMGRALVCAPALSNLFATNAILGVATDAERESLLPGIASGTTLATVAYVDDRERWDLEGVSQTAKGSGDDWKLSGVWNYVLDGHVADQILIVARAEERLGLFCVDGNAAGVERKVLPGLDLTRKLARLELSDVSATRIGEGDATAALENSLALTIAALTAEQLGGAQRCLEMATDYARSRLQFGRPIGSFQAIKHRCADMLVLVEFMKSAGYNACFIAASGEGDLPTAVSMAKSYCSESFFRVAADNIQIHGGMGFTWEHPAHLYFKRAKSGEILFGSPVHHRERLGDKLAL